MLLETCRCTRGAVGLVSIVGLRRSIDADWETLFFYARHEIVDGRGRTVESFLVLGLRSLFVLKHR